MEKVQAVGIDVRTGTVVEGFEKTGTGYRIEASSNEQSMTFEADLVVHAAGRVPNLGSLALDRAGVGQRRFWLQANVFALNRETTGNPAVVEAKGLQYLIDHVARAHPVPVLARQRQNAPLEGINHFLVRHAAQGLHGNSLYGR
jgi:2-polyprenyl-6-methoxyphenol hydroxylase-like FAD-dependent oxidoreductase